MVFMHQTLFQLCNMAKVIASTVLATLIETAEHATQLDKTILSCYGAECFRKWRGSCTSPSLISAPAHFPYTPPFPVVQLRRFATLVK